MLFLTSPECGIPKTQPMEFAQARDMEYPPYLLNFAGSPGERHVENLKVCRFIPVRAHIYSLHETDIERSRHGVLYAGCGHAVGCWLSTLP